MCNLPILSHQVGLVWQGGNGWDDLVREQLEESTLKQRLGNNRWTPSGAGKLLFNFYTPAFLIFSFSFRFPLLS